MTGLSLFSLQQALLRCLVHLVGLVFDLVSLRVARRTDRVSLCVQLVIGDSSLRFNRISGRVCRFAHFLGNVLCGILLLAVASSQSEAHGESRGEHRYLDY